MKSGLVIERLSAGFVLAMKSRESGKFLPPDRKEERITSRKKKILEPVESCLVFSFTCHFVLTT